MKKLLFAVLRRVLFMLPVAILVWGKNLSLPVVMVLVLLTIILGEWYFEGL